MSTGYFARVVDGIVDAVIRAEPEFVASNPSLFPDNWVEVPDMESYPAIGWTWTEVDGFIKPVSVDDPTSEPVDLDVPE